MWLFGTRNYGLVDRVPGLCAVSTRFFHICLLPLIPLRTYLLDAGCRPLQPIPMSLKSVMITYVRAWFSVQAVICYAFPIATFFFLFLIPKPELEQFVAGLIASLILSGMLNFLAICSRKWPGKLAYMVLAAGTFGYLVWDLLRPVIPGKEGNRPSVEGYAITAGAACLICILLLRYFDNASLARAYELGKYFNMSPAEIRMLYPVQANEDDAYHTDLDSTET